MLTCRTERDTEIPTDNRHKTPREIAQYLHDLDLRIGKKYKTYGDLWSVPDGTLQIGLLHLILDSLEVIQDKLSDKPLDMMAGHAAWMTVIHGRVVKAIKMHNKECDRIHKFCDIRLLRSDTRLRSDAYGSLSRSYRSAFARADPNAVFANGRYYYDPAINQIEEMGIRLTSVKSIDDIENLHGIGKVTAAKIREEMNHKCLSSVSEEEVQDETVD